MTAKSFLKKIVRCVVFLTSVLFAQDRKLSEHGSELRIRLLSSQPWRHRAAPAVIWIEPVDGKPNLAFSPHGPYTLLQRDRTFIPHLQIVPVGAAVQFPNADPYFHNVFSLFDGKRFDLGLYETGSSKSVLFSREGISYIFCNIHPQMSAVILALSTPLYAVADANDSFVLGNIPPADYKMNLWIEGVPQTTLDSLSRIVHITSQPLDLGSLKVDWLSSGPLSHTNEFGKTYDPTIASPYTP